MYIYYFISELCLSELVVNPHQQHMDPFHWVMDWEGMLSPSSMVGLLDKNFFRKWLQVCGAENTNVDSSLKCSLLHPRFSWHK